MTSQWRVVASPKSPYDLFTTSFSQNCISWLPEICFSQSKICRTWLCNLQTHMTSIRNDSDVSAPLWHFLCLSMMSPKSPYDLFTTSSGQKCISWLSKICFANLKYARPDYDIRGYICQVSVPVKTFQSHCDTPCDVTLHHQNPRAASLWPPPVKIV